MMTRIFLHFYKPEHHNLTNRWSKFNSVNGPIKAERVDEKSENLFWFVQWSTVQTKTMSHSDFSVDDI